MSDLPSHIPTEMYVGFLDMTIQIHWNYHAILMFTLWMVLVPFSILVMRFFKPKPSEFGLQSKISYSNPQWWWFNVHRLGLYLTVFLSLGGVAVALIVSGGFSGSVHSMFGMLTVAMGCLQVVSAWMRGTHGGKYYNNADLNDPASWRGDQYDHTPRRRMFEAYHKTSGYFTSFFAVGAVGSGLMQYSMPVLTGLMFIIPLAFLATWILLEFLGRWHDGYRAVHGYGMEHPRNKDREFL